MLGQSPRFPSHRIPHPALIRPRRDQVDRPLPVLAFLPLKAVVLAEVEILALFVHRKTGTRLTVKIHENVVVKPAKVKHRTPGPRRRAGTRRVLHEPMQDRELRCGDVIQRDRSEILIVISRVAIRRLIARRIGVIRRPHQPPDHLPRRQRRRRDLRRKNTVTRDRIRRDPIVLHRHRSLRIKHRAIAHLHGIRRIERLQARDHFCRDDDRRTSHPAHRARWLIRRLADTRPERRDRRAIRRPRRCRSQIPHRTDPRRHICLQHRPAKGARSIGHRLHVGILRTPVREVEHLKRQHIFPRHQKALPLLRGRLREDLKSRRQPLAPIQNRARIPRCPTRERLLDQIPIQIAVKPIVVFHRKPKARDQSRIRHIKRKTHHRRRVHIIHRRLQIAPRTDQRRLQPRRIVAKPGTTSLPPRVIVVDRVPPRSPRRHFRHGNRHLRHPRRTLRQQRLQRRRHDHSIRDVLHLLRVAIVAMLHRQPIPTHQRQVASRILR